MFLFGSFVSVKASLSSQKDNDFGFLAMQRGTPPKAICNRLGNCTTQDVEDAIRRDIDEIRSFEKNPEAALLILLQPH
jgi:predicted nuclease of predicted toxin-antitoxin system